MDATFLALQRLTYMRRKRKAMYPTKEKIEKLRLM
jgi:hypothetical protein